MTLIEVKARSYSIDPARVTALSKYSCPGSAVVLQAGVVLIALESVVGQHCNVSGVCDLHVQNLIDCLGCRDEKLLGAIHPLTRQI